MLQKLIEKELPALKKKKIRNRILDSEKLLRSLVKERQLGVDPKNPSGKSRGAHARGGASTRGNYVGVGYRAAGAGRRNKFIHHWKQVKAWHSVQRLEGLQIDQDDVWMKLRDVMESEIRILKSFLGKGKLLPTKQVWLESLEDRVRKLDLSNDYRKTHVDRMMC